MSQTTKADRSKRFDFRGAILHALAQQTLAMPPRELMVTLISDYYLAIDPTPKILNNMLQKLSRKDLLEFVYLKKNYGVKLTQKGRGVFEIINSKYNK